MMLASFIGALLTLTMVLAMIVFVVRFEVRTWRKGRRLDAMVSELRLDSPTRRTEIRQRIRSTPPGAAPVSEMALQDTARNHG